MTPEENGLLCRVEGDAPMGQIMRRHWIAACLSEEVAAPAHRRRSHFLRQAGRNPMAAHDLAHRGVALDTTQQIVFFRCHGCVSLIAAAVQVSPRALS